MFVAATKMLAKRNGRNCIFLLADTFINYANVEPFIIRELIKCIIDDSLACHCWCR